MPGAAQRPRTYAVHVIVNGRAHDLDVTADELLIDMLRERLFLYGTKRSCDVEICGACTVLLDGDAVSSCTALAIEADGRTVRTVEGLADGGRLSALQETFVDEAAMQCGFCTPGFLMSATALLEENPCPTAAEVSHYLNGNICRCGAYNNLLAAVLEAARVSREGSP